MYCAKLLMRATSTGALSTDMISCMSSGERRASVMAVLAPLLFVCQWMLKVWIVFGETYIEWPISVGSFRPCSSMNPSTSFAIDR